MKARVVKAVKKKATVKRAKPTMANNNKFKYGKRIKQLQHIIEDSSYIPEGSTNSYHEFIFSMYKALIQDRKITPKMELAITNIVKAYSRTLNPEYRKNRLDYVDNTIAKLNMIKRRLDECNYTTGYKNSSLYFLDSIEKQVHSRGNLSIKQRKALNKMYTQFTKKIEKNEKIKIKAAIELQKVYESEKSA